MLKSGLFAISFLLVSSTPSPAQISQSAALKQAMPNIITNQSVPERAAKSEVPKWLQSFEPRCPVSSIDLEPRLISGQTSDPLPSANKSLSVEEDKAAQEPILQSKAASVQPVRGPVPDTITQLVGGSFRFFKTISAPANTREIFIARGEMSAPPDFHTRGPWVRIKLTEFGTKNGITLNGLTKLNIISVNQGIMLVDDPAIEFIELRRDNFSDSTFVWDLALALDSTVQITCPDGSVIEKEPLGGLALR